MDAAELRASLVSFYIGITLHNPIISKTNYSFVASLIGNDIFDMSPHIDQKGGSIECL